MFGVQFDPSGLFRVRLVNESATQIVLCAHVEFHSSTSVVCHFDKFLMPPGIVEVQASNDGIHYGIGAKMTLYGMLKTMKTFNNYD